MRDSRPSSLAGVAFAALFVAAFVLLGGDGPDYSAPDREWVDWAVDSETSNRISMLLVTLAAMAFLVFAGALREALSPSRWATTAVAGGVVGVTGIVTAFMLTGAASVQGADIDVTASRAIVESSVAGFLLTSCGFATLLGAAGLATRSSGVLPRWTGIVALVGAFAFVVTFGTLIDGSDESALGAGFPLGFLCLVIWTIAASLKLSAVRAEPLARPLPSTR